MDSFFSGALGKGSIKKRERKVGSSTKGAERHGSTPSVSNSRGRQPRRSEEDNDDLDIDDDDDRCGELSSSLGFIFYTAYACIFSCLSRFTH